MVKKTRGKSSTQKGEKQRTEKKPSWRRRSKIILRTVIVLFLLLAGACDWFVHQTRVFRNQAREKLGDYTVDLIENFGDEIAVVTDDIGITGRDVRAPLNLFGGGTSTSYGGFPRPQSRSVTFKTLSKRGFAIGYSENLRVPLWVAYRLHKVDKLASPPRPSTFKPDPDTGAKVPHKAYTGSGYDRGHMAPNFGIASRFGKKSQQQTFLTSNIVPQRPALNRGTWRKLEWRIASGYAQWREVVWVITGPIFGKTIQRLKSGVAIPRAFFKVILSEQDGDLYALAFVMPQRTHARRKARRFLVSIDEIESLTALDLLHLLPDKLEKAVEARNASRLWPLGIEGMLDTGQRKITRLFSSR